MEKISKPIKMVKINDIEFKKIIRIFGAYALIQAYINWQVNLSSEQLEKAIDIKNGLKKE